MEDEIFKQIAILIKKQYEDHKLIIESLAENETNRRQNQALLGALIDFIRKYHPEYEEMFIEEYQNNFRIGMEASLSANFHTISAVTKSFLQGGDYNS
jgi:hypothetical protein